jgi:hypothetical protein
MHPDSHAEASFKVILKQKFIEGLDENLQLKVKHKDYDTFDELVAATRKYCHEQFSRWPGYTY